MKHETHQPSVLMIGPSLNSRGGMATVEKQYFEAGIEARCDVQFISSYDDGGKVKKVWIALSGFLRFLVKLSSCDIVHVHMASYASFDRKRVFLRTAHRAGKKTIIHLHGGRFEEFVKTAGPRKRNKILQTFAKADAVIVLSAEWKGFAQREIGLSKNIVVLPNAVSVPPHPSVSSGPREVLFLGRLSSQKGVDTLLKAAQIVHRQYPEVKFHFAGDGDSESYRLMADRLGVGEVCEFYGWIDKEQREHLFDACSVFCLPSKAEGLPMSMLEAMAHGLVAIVTPVGGVPQVIEHGVNGYIVPIGDSDQLAERLCGLAADRGKAKGLAARGRETVEKEYNLATSVGVLEELYDCLAIEQ